MPFAIAYFITALACLAGVIIAIHRTDTAQEAFLIQKKVFAVCAAYAVLIFATSLFF